MKQNKVIKRATETHACIW